MRQTAEVIVLSADYGQNKGMRNILLILENSLELNLTKTVLQKLGFQVLWLQRGADMHQKLSQNFPDLVITSVLGTQDEFLNEFIQVRQKRGIPRFIWVGPTSRLDRLKTAQRQLIDSNLPTPIQPDVLIEQVCELFELDVKEYLQKYRSLMTSHQPAKNTVHITGGKTPPMTNFDDPERAKKYQDFLKNVPKLDKTFSLKEIDKKIRAEGEPQGNSQDLLEKKRAFVKSLLKK